jgi:hypothetical protein
MTPAQEAARIVLVFSICSILSASIGSAVAAVLAFIEQPPLRWEQIWVQWGSLVLILILGSILRRISDVMEIRAKKQIAEAKLRNDWGEQEGQEKSEKARGKTKLSKVGTGLAVTGAIMLIISIVCAVYLTVQPHELRILPKEWQTVPHAITVYYKHKVQPVEVLDSVDIWLVAGTFLTIAGEVLNDKASKRKGNYVNQN